jgi:PTS system nitrogen regulatory IIA component
MLLREILSPDRATRMDARDLTKSQALALVASLLARQTNVPETEILEVLHARESLQSTGIGDGVAIPHGSLPNVEQHVAALLVAPNGVPFDAIDNAPVNLFFAVLGPRAASGEHLKILARISRLLRRPAFRETLLRAPDGANIFRLVEAEEGG